MRKQRRADGTANHADASSVPATPPCGHHVCFLPESRTRATAMLRFALIFGLWGFNFYMPGGRAGTVEQNRRVPLSIPPFPALCLLLYRMCCVVLCYAALFAAEEKALAAQYCRQAGRQAAATTCSPQSPLSSSNGEGNRSSHFDLPAQEPRQSPVSRFSNPNKLRSSTRELS